MLHHEKRPQSSKINFGTSIESLIENNTKKFLLAVKLYRYL